METNAIAIWKDAMVVDDLHMSPSYRLTRTLSLLESLYVVTIDFDAASNLSELQEVYEAYDQVRTGIIKESAFNSYDNDPRYSEAVLIQEAISIFLSEVAPKRIKRTKTSS